jgi:hypothetical protein
MNLTKWLQYIKPNFKLYQDGFFEFPYLANSPQMMIQSAVKTPTSKHVVAEQAVYRNNPFTKGVMRYREIEEGFWITASNIEFKQNALIKTIYDEDFVSDYYTLTFTVFESQIKLQNTFADKVPFQNKYWAFKKPGTVVGAYFYKGSMCKFYIFSFSEDWGGPLAGDAEPVAAVLDEESRPEPDRQGQLRCRQSQRLAGIGRGRIGTQADGTVGGGFLTGGHPFGHRGPFPQHRHDVGLGVGGDVEGAVVHPVLGGSDDPALVAAAERHWFVQSTAGGAGGGRAAGQGPGAGSTDYRGGDPGRAEQSASRHPLRLSLGRGVVTGRR